MLTQSRIHAVFSHSRTERKGIFHAKQHMHFYFSSPRIQTETRNFSSLICHFTYSRALTGKKREISQKSVICVVLDDYGAMQKVCHPPRGEGVRLKT